MYNIANVEAFTSICEIISCIDYAFINIKMYIMKVGEILNPAVLLTCTVVLRYWWCQNGKDHLEPFFTPH